MRPCCHLTPTFPIRLSRPAQSPFIERGCIGKGDSGLNYPMIRLARTRLVATKTEYALGDLSYVRTTSLPPQDPSLIDVFQCLLCRASHLPSTGTRSASASSFTTLTAMAARPLSLIRKKPRESGDERSKVWRSFDYRSVHFH